MPLCNHPNCPCHAITRFSLWQKALLSFNPIASRIRDEMALNGQPFPHLYNALLLFLLRVVVEGFTTTAEEELLIIRPHLRSSSSLTKDCFRGETHD